MPTSHPKRSVPGAAVVALAVAVALCVAYPLSMPAGIIGAAVGVIVASYGTYYACVLVDKIRGASGGDGIVTIGWLFLILTAPIGGVVGAFSFVALARILFR